MPNYVLNMEKANLFCGSGPNNQDDSNHLVLTELKLPAIDVQFVDHRPGGGPVAIEIDTIVAKLESTFQLVGWTPQVATLVDSWIGTNNDFYAYGAVRDRQNGNVFQAAAFMHGMLGRADPQNWRVGDPGHWNYAIKGILHYELFLGQNPIYQWDFASNTWVVGGVNLMAQINQALNVTSNIPPLVLQSIEVPTQGG